MFSSLLQMDKLRDAFEINTTNSFLLTKSAQVAHS